MITRSTEEWLMSRSCHRGMFSREASALVRRSRESPQRFSAEMGFFLWGMAEEPFWPLPKPSSTSSTSVRWRWRSSVHSRSTPPPSRARAVK